jgi:DNA repair ATPase RecN
LLQINSDLFAENTARSQNEQLYAAWQKSEMERQQIYNANQNLREELQIMKLEIESLKTTLKPSNKTLQDDVISDNNLAVDTKWVRVENSKKKRKLADRISPQQATQNAIRTSINI